MLDHEGRVWFRSALDESSLDELADACDARDAPGQRLLCDVPAALNTFAHQLLRGARPVRIVAFEKTVANNWSLPWHQDRVVALKERIEMPGFTNWTRKAGIWHAEPPIEMLKRMIFARIHLDPADAENGCLQLALGTHAHGKVAACDAEPLANAAPLENCIADRGDVLFAKALILHRSAPSRSRDNRRAVRIDYCADELPPPLQWAA